MLRVSGGPGDTTVPDVTGKPEATATAQLAAAGFEVKSQSRASSDVDGGRWSSARTPAGATTAEKGSTVTIVVSSGAEQVDVPDVTGQSQSGAEQTLRDAGLVPSASTSPSSEDEPAGTVISQDPDGGTRSTAAAPSTSWSPPRPPT